MFCSAPPHSNFEELWLWGEGYTLSMQACTGLTCYERAWDPHKLFEPQRSTQMRLNSNTTSIPPPSSRFIHKASSIQFDSGLQLG